MRRFIFIHIPKTGGRYVVVNLAERQLTHKVEVHARHATYKDTMWAFDTKNVDYIPFSIVRNPYNWLESWYNFFFVHLKSERTRTFNSFEDFIMNIETGERTSSNFDTIATQSTYTRDMVNILQLENLKEECEEFFGFEFYTKEHTETLVDRWENVESISNEYYEELIWTPEMIQRVNTLFAEDFKNFGYTTR